MNRGRPVKRAFFPTILVIAAAGVVGAVFFMNRPPEIEVVTPRRGAIHESFSEPARTRLPDTWKQVLHLMRYELRSQGIQTRVELEEHLPTLQGDRIELQQVLINLLRNSIEAMNGTEMKQRHLTISAATTNEDSVTVFVRDAGCGLGEATPDSIYEPFYTTKKDGTGMGLAISRTIIEAHGGKLEATNNADVGCTFHFSLPRSTRA